MDALRSKDSKVNLAAAVCQALQAGQVRSCNSAADCANPVSACISASPELSFKHQVSTIDSRVFNVPDGQAVDRAVVHANIQGTSLWKKLYPFQNVYDAQAENVFPNCIFDPDDDGSNEDSFFDPTNPSQLLGPSSTCFPEFAFSYLGDTDEPFQADKIGRASEGPGLRGSLGPGTWVESRFDLSSFRGRAIKIRFLFTSIKINENGTYGSFNLFGPWDDGWYIDDVRVTQTVGTATPTVTVDTAANSSLPGCGNACNTLTPSLTANPSSLPAPGWLVVLSAQSSSADRCLDGTLLFEFWIDGDANGNLGDPQDTLLREFSTNPILEEAPSATTRYGVRVKCSSAVAGPCNASQATVLVPVTCPGAGTFQPGAWWARVTFAADKATLQWPPVTQGVDAVRGNLGTLRAGSFAGTSCLLEDANVTSLTDAAIPSPAGGFYYLLRGTSGYCNENRSWSTLHPRENPSNPGKRDAEITACSP